MYGSVKNDVILAPECRKCTLRGSDFKSFHGEHGPLEGCTCGASNPINQKILSIQWPAVSFELGEYKTTKKLGREGNTLIKPFQSGSPKKKSFISCNII